MFGLPWTDARKTVSNLLILLFTAAHLINSSMVRKCLVLFIIKQLCNNLGFSYEGTAYRPATQSGVYRSEGYAKPYNNSYKAHSMEGRQSNQRFDYV